MRRMILVALALACLAAPAYASDAVLGSWLTQDRDGVVEILPCADSVCGRVGTANVANGQRDERNPDPALRNRLIVGLTILQGFTRTAKGWEGGTIYDPETGRTYRADLLPQSDGTLRLRGCIRGTPLCRNEIWTRAN